MRIKVARLLLAADPVPPNSVPKFAESHPSASASECAAKLAGPSSACAPASSGSLSRPQSTTPTATLPATFEPASEAAGFHAHTHVLTRCHQSTVELLRLLSVHESLFPNVLSYLRTYKGRAVLVALNMSSTRQRAKFDLSAQNFANAKLSALAASEAEAAGSEVSLEPFGAFVGEVVVGAESSTTTNRNFQKESHALRGQQRLQDHQR